MIMKYLQRVPQSIPSPAFANLGALGIKSPTKQVPLSLIHITEKPDVYIASKRNGQALQRIAKHAHIASSHILLKSAFCR